MPKKKIKTPRKRKARAGKKPAQNIANQRIETQPSPEVNELKNAVASLSRERDSVQEELARVSEQITKLTKMIAPPQLNQFELLGEFEEDLNKKHMIIRNLRQDLLEAREKIDGTDAVIKTKDDKIEELSVSVSQLKKINADQRKYLLALEESEQAKEAKIEELQKRIESLPVTPVSGEKEAATADKLIAQQDEEITQLKAQITESGSADTEGPVQFAEMVIRKEEILHRLKETALDLEKANQSKDEEIKELEADIFALKKRISTLEALAKEGEAAMEKDKEISSLKADNAWLKELNDTLKSQRRFVT